jgi:hypothetical protein
MYDVYIQGYKLNTEKISIAVTCLTYILVEISAREQVILSSCVAFLVTFLEHTLSVLQPQLRLPPAFTLVSCLAYSSTLKIEATCSSETSVYFQRTTRRYITEDRILHKHRCENVQSYTVILNLVIYAIAFIRICTTIGV